MGLKTFLKNIYRIVPFKKQVFLLIKSFNLPHCIYKHLHFKGEFNIKVKNKSIKIYHHGYELENELFWKGVNGWEKQTIKYWIWFSKRSNVIFDIGANTGIFSLLSKCINENSQVYAFEPIPKAFEYLNKNIALNNYNIISTSYALSNFDGTAKIYLPHNSNFAYSVTVNKNYLKNIPCQEIEIKTITLKSFILSNNITKIDLMKIDVETHEPEVLEGMGEFLEGFQPILFIEILNKECADKIKYIFSELKSKYHFFEINEKTGITQNNQLFSEYSKNYILIPEKKLYLLNEQ